MNHRSLPAGPLLALPLLLLLALAGPALAQPALAPEVLRPVEPRCEYLVDPRGIDQPRPRLSWKLVSDRRSQRQSAFRVLVASEPALLAADQGDLWDTGKVASDQTTQLAYQGVPLPSRQRCHWKVQVWDQNDEPSAWSAPAMWSMGLLAPSDWQAGWIGFDRVPERPVVEASKIDISQALYGPADDPGRQVDLREVLGGEPSTTLESFFIDNELAGVDPAPGEPKVLRLDYRIDGVKRRRVLAEGSAFNFHNTDRPKLLERTYLPSPHLRKEFEVNSPIRRATLSVSAEGVFEMHLNGQRVGDEVFQPGWTDYRKRVYHRTYDVTDLLQQGPNALGGILGDGWFRGNISILGQNQYGEKLRLIAQLDIDRADGTTQTVATDASWKAAFGPITKSDMQAGETYDARLEMPGWNAPGFDDSAWAAVDLGRSLDSPLEAHPSQPVRRTLEVQTVSVTEPLEGIHVYDLGQNFSGWVRLKVSGQAGDRVTMRFGEMLSPDGTVFTDNLRSARATNTYVLKGGGEETWEPTFTFHGFRYVEVTGVGPSPPADLLTGVVIHTDAPMTSSFECSDPMLNQLHRNVVWGQRSNYLEVPTDCPQRDERLGWTGDTQVYIRSGTYHQDVAAFFTKWMVDVVDSANPRGVFGRQAPVFHGHGSPGWSDAGIIVPWTIYKVYGDTRIITEHYDAMARYLEACGRNGLDGLGNGFGDWLAVGSQTPKELISVAYYAYVTHLLAEMAEAVGKHDDARAHRELFARIREHFQDRFVAADGTVLGDSQTGYCMALRYDLLTEAQRERAAEHLVNRIEANGGHLSVGFLGVAILLPTLTDIGRSDVAYRLLQNRSYPSWGYSVEQGATTVWERWNSFTLEEGLNAGAMNSFNHYAYGACSEWMFHTLLGIDYASPGFATVRMKPQVGHGVSWAKGHHDSIRGRIASDWRLENGVLTWAVEIPANTTAELHVPTARTAAIRESGEPITEADGVEGFRIANGETTLHVGSGSYRFVIELPEP